jgi:hypothetical protein
MNRYWSLSPFGLSGKPAPDCARALVVAIKSPLLPLRKVRVITGNRRHFQREWNWDSLDVARGMS